MTKRRAWQNPGVVLHSAFGTVILLAAFVAPMAIEGKVLVAITGLTNFYAAYESYQRQRWWDERFEELERMKTNANRMAQETLEAQEDDQ